MTVLFVCIVAALLTPLAMNVRAMMRELYELRKETR